MRRILALLFVTGMLHGFAAAEEEMGNSRPREDKVAVDLAKRLIDSFRTTKGTNQWEPHLGPLDTWSLSVDTYSHGVPSSTIAALYNRACAKFATFYKKEMKTYYWLDVEGYPRLATVVQYHNEVSGPSYLLVAVYNNNDNDNFHFSYLEGVFEIKQGKGKYPPQFPFKIKIMGDWHIPKGLLRHDAQ